MMIGINNTSVARAQMPHTDSLKHNDGENSELTWNEILYDGGIGAWIPRSSFRWLAISICVIGVLGNILAVCTLLRRRMRTLSTYAYLTALCLSNTISLLSAIIFQLDVLFAPSRFNCITILVAKALASSTIALSTWITVGFTVDRYIMICFPFSGEKLCTRRNSIYVIISCLFLALTYLVPQLLSQTCHTIAQYHYNYANISFLNDSSDSSNLVDPSELTFPHFWVPSLSDFGKSLAYRLTVNLFIHCLLVRVIPFAVVFKLNVHLIQTLTRAKRRHRQMNPYEQKRNDVTYMLVIVISIYLICVMPSIPFAAFFAYDPEKYVAISFRHRIIQHLDELGILLIIFNSASQCFLYIFFGKRFRRELMHIICCFCPKHIYQRIPYNYSNSDRDTFAPVTNGTEEMYELILNGKWSFDQRQNSLSGVEFSFSHPRRWSRLTSSSATTTRSESDYSDSTSRINLDLLSRLKTRVGQLFGRFK